MLSCILRSTRCSFLRRPREGGQIRLCGPGLWLVGAPVRHPHSHTVVTRRVVSPRCSRDAACHSVTSHVLQVPAVAYNPRRDPIAAIIRAAYCYRAVRRASNSRPVRCHTIQDALVSRGCKSETYVSRCEISKFSVKMPCVRTATRSCTATLRRNLSRAIRHRKTTRGTTCGTQHGTKRGTTDAGDALAPSEIRVKSDERLVSRLPSGG
jgi:hypothetical protein